MLEGMGFVPYHMNEHFQKPGFGQSFQKWSKGNLEVFRKASDRHLVVKRTNTGWADIYSGKANPSLIRSILEVNGLIEASQEAPTPNSDYPSFSEEANIARSEFSTILREYLVSDHNALRTAADTLLIMFDQAVPHFPEQTKTNSFREGLADLMREYGAGSFLLTSYKSCRGDRPEFFLEFMNDNFKSILKIDLNNGETTPDMLRGKEEEK